MESWRLAHTHLFSSTQTPLSGASFTVYILRFSRYRQRRVPHTLYVGEKITTTKTSSGCCIFFGVMVDNVFTIILFIRLCRLYVQGLEIYSSEGRNVRSTIHWPDGAHTLLHIGSSIRQNSAGRLWRVRWSIDADGKSHDRCATPLGLQIMDRAEHDNRTTGNTKMRLNICAFFNNKV